MALNLQDKQAIVAEVSEVAKGALSAVVADSRGVTVDKMTELRKAGREAGVYMRVVRNTLLRRVVEGTQFECLKDTFVVSDPDCIPMEHPALLLVCSKSSRKRMQNLRSKLQPLKVS